ncbi:MAG: hypothetical protein J6A63_04840 [Clostridia bacterium]|nr:hypothetical protein [Clostridia bacterium]
MIFNFYYPEFTDEEWIYIIKKYLKGFTEIPLNRIYGCDLEELKFYDGLFGTLLKHTEYIIANYPKELNKKFVNSWRYQGKLYRVMHKTLTVGKDGREIYRFRKINYHGMITHWTDDYTFKGLMHKLSDDEEYIILEADTREHFAFDVNKFRKVYKCEEFYTKNEREFIFPMYKENIKEYRMTIKEFIQMHEEQGN